MVGLRRTPAMIGLGLLTLLSVAACLLPAWLAHGVTRYSIGLLLLIPASYVLVALSCAFIVLLIEGAGPFASYQRSWRLTAGSFWRLSLVYTVGIIVLVVMSFVISMVAVFLAAIVGRGDVVLAAAATGVTIIALGAITTPFYTALGLAVFGDLTARKEGSTSSSGSRPRSERVRGWLFALVISVLALPCAHAREPAQVIDDCLTSSIRR